MVSSLQSVLYFVLMETPMRFIELKLHGLVFNYDHVFPLQVLHIKYPQLIDYWLLIKETLSFYLFLLITYAVVKVKYVW